MQSKQDTPCTASGSDNLGMNSEQNSCLLDNCKRHRCSTMPKGLFYDRLFTGLVFGSIASQFGVKALRQEVKTHCET